MEDQHFSDVRSAPEADIRLSLASGRCALMLGPMLALVGELASCPDDGISCRALDSPAALAMERGRWSTVESVFTGLIGIWRRAANAERSDAVKG